MKKLYWRPQQVSLRVLAMLTFVAVCSFAAIETFKVREQQPYYREKMRAAQTALEAMRAVRAERLRRGIPIDVETDPADSGLIGELLSPVTTNIGHTGAKQTSVNPNFAAVMVHLLKRANVGEGDTVAIGMSGSFPAMNIAVLAAVEALHLRPIIIASIGSSQWGANHPDFMWTDMEKLLSDGNILPYRSAAVSPGGVDDRALGLSKAGKQMLRAAIERTEVPVLEPKGYTDGIEQRMALYRQQAGDAEIRAYVNVGGGTTSVGTRVGKEMFKPGLNTDPPRGPAIDSVMSRFAQSGVPVIHLIKIDALAQRHGLPLQPQAMQPVGQGKVFVKVVYNRWLAGATLAMLFGAMVGLLRFDLGHRLLGRRVRSASASEVEPMV